MTLTIHCKVVEVPDMNDEPSAGSGGFRDLVPWADPYIAALLEKLRRAAAAEEFEARTSDPACELPPPLDTNDRGDRWQVDWSPRNWPRG